jgi:glycosyltransferase involved in cell wall biosynthesis
MQQGLIMIKSTPKISIIIPIKISIEDCANLQKNILNTLSMIENVEIILVFDGDEKQTEPELINAGSAKIVRGNFGNPGGARNAGLQESSGEWIWFVDSDDILVVDHLKDLVPVLQDGEADIYIGQYLHYLELENVRHLHKDRDFQAIGIDLGIWRMIFSKSAILHCRFPSFPLGEDQYFLGLINLPKRRLRYLDQPIYSYQSGVEGQATSRKSNFFRIIESLHALDYLRKDQTGSDHEFTSIMYWRQIITLTKRGNVRLKLEAILVGLKSLMRINRNYFRSMRALMYVLVRVLVRNA